MHHSSNFGRNPQQVKRSSVAITGTTVYTKHFHSWVRKSNVVQYLCLMLSQNAGDSRAKNTGGTPLKCWREVATRTLRILQWKFVHSTTNVHNKSRPNTPNAAPATQSHAAPCFPFVFLFPFLSVTCSFCYAFVLWLCLCDISSVFMLHTHSFSLTFLSVTFPFAYMLISSPTFSFWLSSWFWKSIYHPEADQIKLPLEYSQNSCWHLLKTDRFNHNQIISFGAS